MKRSNVIFFQNLIQDGNYKAAKEFLDGFKGHVAAWIYIQADDGSLSNCHLIFRVK